MQTILGANGIIGEELVKELKAKYTSDIRIVGRNPKKINESDTLHKADLLKPDEVKEAVKGSDIVFLTVGLPYNSKIWLRDWEPLMENVIRACMEYNAKLVYFDNTYAYPQDAIEQTEETPMTSTGKKGIARATAAKLMLKAMEEKKIEGAICRAPEFYGPGKTKAFTNALVFESLKTGKKPKIFLRDDVLRTLIYTPDAGKAMALIGNTLDAYGTTWHLPCDDNRLTYREFIEEISTQLGRNIDYMVLKPWLINILALFNTNLKETKELLPRYAIDNLFISDKFKKVFPDFKVTTYKEGIKAILDDYVIS
ncbi:NAD-dependent epimerase/dehydratase family protein [Ekhidna sp.]|uniref:NAD-dependent epimerase/dehydratase family protein n=1 Tax=Ekhidna sp. TaxID=2608089 RepID=UPI003C7C31D9